MHCAVSLEILFGRRLFESEYKSCSKKNKRSARHRRANFHSEVRLKKCKIVGCECGRENGWENDIYTV